MNDEQKIRNVKIICFYQALSSVCLISSERQRLFVGLAKRAGTLIMLQEVGGSCRFQAFVRCINKLGSAICSGHVNDFERSEEVLRLVWT